MIVASTIALADPSPRVRLSEASGIRRSFLRLTQGRLFELAPNVLSRLR
jgi:hypothetical protein